MKIFAKAKAAETGRDNQKGKGTKEIYENIREEEKKNMKDGIVS